MTATMTSKGQITIPIGIRKKLGLHTGQKLKFDLNAPYLKAQKVVDENSWKAVVGCLKGKVGGKTAQQIVNELRGRPATSRNTGK